MKKGKKLSRIVTMHYIKLVYRSALFLLALGIFVYGCIVKGNYQLVTDWLEARHWILIPIAVIYVIEMLTRFFPSKLESPGCQKQFKRNYKPTGEEKPELMSWKRTFVAAASWFALNGAIGALYFLGVINKDILILISLAYGICDIICILFFCPFQTWMMKNRCCTVCRIYNWDFPMMFTPFVFIPHWFTYTMLAMALGLLVRWEITYKLHPERFSDKTNACLTCANCDEKLCHHKKQLHSFWKKNKGVFSKR